MHCALMLVVILLLSSTAGNNGINTMALAGIVVAAHLAELFAESLILKALPLQAGVTVA